MCSLTVTPPCACTIMFLRKYVLQKNLLFMLPHAFGNFMQVTQNVKTQKFVVAKNAYLNRYTNFCV